MRGEWGAINNNNHINHYQISMIESFVSINKCVGDREIIYVKNAN